jgi:hypothetical protein
MSDHPSEPVPPRERWRGPASHLSAGQIREYLDGEIHGLSALRCGLHLAICRRCAKRRRSVKARGNTVATLLELSGTPSRRPRARNLSVPAMSVMAIATLSVATAGVLFSYGPFGRQRIADRSQVKDVCCFDLDGGSRMDDGIVTVSRAGQVVDCVVVYEDRAGTRAFAAGDPLLFLSHKKACGDAGLRDAPGPGKFAAARGT